MKIIDTAITDVKIIEPQVFGDERGFFMETFRTTTFNEQCAERDFVQENHSKSSQGILRGLHYQTENTQGKLVRVVKGEVFDVAVDMRKDSPTFGQWVASTFLSKTKNSFGCQKDLPMGFTSLQKKPSSFTNARIFTIRMLKYLLNGMTLHWTLSGHWLTTCHPAYQPKTRQASNLQKHQPFKA